MVFKGRFLVSKDVSVSSTENHMEKNNSFLAETPKWVQRIGWTNGMLSDKKGWSEHLPGLESPRPLAVTSKVQVILLIELFHLISHTTCLDKYQVETVWWFHFSHFSSLTPEPQTGHVGWHTSSTMALRTTGICR